MKEGDLKQPIIDYIKLLGGDLIRINSGGYHHGVRLAPAGTPDLIGYLKGGRHLEIETKLPYNDLSQKQREHIEKVNQAGGIAFCAKSLDDVIVELKEAGEA